MPATCDNCGAELFAGQRFCRACGKPTDQFVDERAPTMRMPEPADGRGGRPVDTAPPATPYTNPFYNPPPGYHPATQLPYPPYAQPTRSKGPLAWIMAMLIAGFIVIVVTGALIIGVGRRPVRRVASPPPADRATSPSLRPGEVLLGEDGAEVSARETRITKSFTITPGAKLSVENINGDIRVEGWDQSKAELDLVKSGRSALERRNVAVAVSNDAGGLSFRTAQPGGAIKVEYVLRVPRSLKHVQVKLAEGGDVILSGINADVSVQTNDGAIDLSDINGQISATNVDGSIDLRAITGSAAVTTVGGDTRVTFDQVTPGRPLKFRSVTGRIEVIFKSEVNLDLEAATAAGGEIDLDSDFGVEVKKTFVGERAKGRIGTGGQQLEIKTVSGDIRLTRAQ